MPPLLSLACACTGFYESRRDAIGRPGFKHYVLALQRSATANEAAFMTSRRVIYRIQRPSTGPGKAVLSGELKEVYRPIARGRAKAGWNLQHSRSVTECLHGPNCAHAGTCKLGMRHRIMHVIGGSLLPVWSKVEEVMRRHTGGRSTKSGRGAASATRAFRLKVTRICTDDGRRIVGVAVPSEHVVRMVQRAIEGKEEETKEEEATEGAHSAPVPLLMGATALGAAAAPADAKGLPHC